MENYWYLERSFLKCNWLYSLNFSSFPLENVVSNLPIQTQPQQSQTTMFNSSNSNNSNNNVNYATNNIGTNSPGLNPLTLLGINNPSMNQSNIGSDLLLNPQHIRSYQMLKQTLGNVNPIIPNNLSVSELLKCRTVLK